MSWTIPIGRDALSFISQMQNWFPPRGILEEGRERTRVPPSYELVIRGWELFALADALSKGRGGGERGASFRIWEKRSSFASLILTKGREGGKGGRSSGVVISWRPPLRQSLFLAIFHLLSLRLFVPPISPAIYSFLAPAL